MHSAKASPLLTEKNLNSPWDFTFENLPREARRRKGLEHSPVLQVCVVDPDGDRVRVEDDFEKGEAEGTVDALAVNVAAPRAWRSTFCAIGPGGKEP